MSAVELTLGELLASGSNVTWGDLLKKHEVSIEHIKASLKPQGKQPAAPADVGEAVLRLIAENYVNGEIDLETLAENVLAELVERRVDADQAG